MKKLIVRTDKRDHVFTVDDKLAESLMHSYVKNEDTNWFWVENCIFNRHRIESVEVEDA